MFEIWFRGGRGDRDRSSNTRSEPLNPVFSLHREMNRLFDDVFRDFGGSSFGAGRGSWPSLDVDETEKEYLVTAELPGLEEREVEVLFQDGVLTIRGEKKLEKEWGNRTYSERYYGRFERQITLDRQIDEGAIAAKFRNGILKVSIPKSVHSDSFERRELNACSLAIQAKG